jgi:ribulose-phosphate 3-epimerase
VILIDKYRNENVSCNGEDMMGKLILCPSIMCADYRSLAEEIAILEQGGADIMHIDVMDGAFVPNFACGPEILKAVRSLTKIPVDVHLMINEPSRYIAMFSELGADIIYIHPEAGAHAARTLAKIKDLGKSSGLAINPGTSVEAVKELLPLCSYVLAMTVNPGFAGQKFLEFTTNKIKELGELSSVYGFTLCVDGAISREKITELLQAGVSGFVLGTSALFNKNRPYSDIIREIRAENSKFTS